MYDLAHYPEDRGEIYGETNEEEAALYFTLMEFTQVVDKYGIDFIMMRLDRKTVDQIDQWIQDVSEC